MKMINIRTITFLCMACLVSGNITLSAQTSQGVEGASKVELAIPVAGIVKSSSEDQRVEMIMDNRAEYTIGSSAVVISGDELRRNHHPNLLSALSGRVPGLIMMTEDSTPSYEEYSMNTRGTGLEPIILIDGFEGDLTSININDVESVSIIKDGASVLYGMHAPGGVINVVTYRGKQGAPTVNVSANYTLQKPLYTPSRLGSADHVTLTTQAYENDIYTTNSNPYNTLEIIGFTTGSDPDLFHDNDWYNMFMQEYVQTMDFSFSASGGSEKVNYYTSVGYLNQTSPFKQESSAAKMFGTDQFTVRSNVDFQIGPIISGFANISGRINRNVITPHEDGTAGILDCLYDLKPTDYGPLTPYVDEDDQGGKVIMVSDADPIYGRLNSSGYNQQQDIDFITNFGLEADLSFIAEGLIAYGSMGYVGNYLSELYGTTNYERYQLYDANYPYTLSFVRYDSSSYEDTILDYSKSTSSYFKREIVGGLSYDHIFNNTHTAKVHAFAKNDYVNSSDIDAYYPLRRVTFSGQATYGYKDIIFADYMASYQGSEEFTDENRWGFFNTASASLVLSNMDFLKDNDIISYLRLRGSYGTVGSDNFGLDYRFAYQEDLATTGTTYIKYVSSAYVLSKMGNSELTWEKYKTTSIGVDLSILDKLTFSAEAYSVYGSDILIEDTLTPGYYGVDTDALALINAGETETKGFELQLGYLDQVAPDFTVGLSSYFSFYEKIIVYDGEMEQLGYPYPYSTTGFRSGQCWGKEIDYSFGDGSGYFNSLDDISASGLTYDGTTPRPGDFVYVDQNGDKIIDDKDIVPMGDTKTPQINWGAEVFLQWKNVDFSVLFQGTGMYTGFNSGLGYYSSTNGGVYFEQHKTAWTAERYAAGEEITGPALTMAGSSSQVANDYWLQDKSYTRIKNVELGYSFSPTLLKKLDIRKMRVYASVTNAYTFDHYEYDLQDVEGSILNAYGTPRYYNVGLNITF